jgi:hypothetical protein
LKRAGVPVHRAREILAIHQCRQKGGIGRPRERARRAADKQADVNPVNRCLERRNNGHAQTHGYDDSCHQHYHPLAIVIVRDVSRRQREQKHRNHLRQPNKTQRQRGTGAFINFPNHRQHEHLLTEHCYEATHEVNREIPVPKNGIRMPAWGFWLRRHRQIFR